MHTTCSPLHGPAPATPAPAPAGQGLLDQLSLLRPHEPGSTAGAPDAAGDVVMAALFLAMEDDAVKTRTHIPLPVQAFSSRLDTVAAVRAGRWVLMPRRVANAARTAAPPRHATRVPWGPHAMARRRPRP